MGVSKNTYVGPYLKINKIPTEKVEKKDSYKICPNENCSIHLIKAVGEFCSNCGTKNILHTNKQYIDKGKNIYDLMFEFGEEDIFFVYENLCLMNRRSSYNKSDDEPFLLNMDENYISNALTSFNKDYSEFMSFLKESGVEFDVKFGVISYYW